MAKGELKKQFQEVLEEREKKFLTKSIEELKRGEKLLDKIGNIVFGVGIFIFATFGFFFSLLALVLVGIPLELNFFPILRVGNVLWLFWFFVFMWCWIISYFAGWLRKKKEERLK